MRMKNSIYIFCIHNKIHNCRDNFCLKGQGLDHVGILGNFVVPHWKENLSLYTL